MPVYYLFDLLLDTEPKRKQLEYTSMGLLKDKRMTYVVAHKLLPALQDPHGSVAYENHLNHQISLRMGLQ